jgi:phosphoglucomutase
MTSVLRTIEANFQAVAVDDQTRQAALDNLAIWLEQPRFATYVPAIQSLVQRGSWEALVDCFYRMLPFGTGGRRGAVGVGPNRMNPYTVVTSVQGHCQFLASRFPGQELSVVLACDVREFFDIRGAYDKAALGDMYGMSSKDFTCLAAQVYAANGVTAVMADPAETTFVSTPELSYHIYALGAHGGLNMSASHNHPDDNGAKFYNAAGGQEVPPHDEELVRIASGVIDASLVSFDEARERGLVRFLTDKERNGYIQLNVALSQCDSRSARVAYSPLNGTGLSSVLPVLMEAGFHVELVDGESDYDGAFPLVPFRLPNPEYPAVMKGAIETAKAKGCDMALATDPDADRLGVASPDKQGKWHCFTGNQIGILMAWHILGEMKSKGKLTPAHYMVKTEVTTDMLTALARHFDVRIVGHLLVGFKYIGGVLDEIARTGRFGDLEAKEADFLLAMEESHGVLTSPLVRDKDAANGALTIAELASRCKEQGTTLYELLNQLYKQFGYYGTTLQSMVMEGAAGLANIRKLQSSMRASPPRAIGGREVVEFHDRQDEGGPFGSISSETDRASRDVLVFRLEGGFRLTLRPSGTEPKNKSYIELAAAPLGDRATDEQLARQIDGVNLELARLVREWEIELMSRLGVPWPAYAPLFSDTLSMDRKRYFVDNIAKELESALTGDSAVKDWAHGMSRKIEEVAPMALLKDGLSAFALGLSLSAQQRMEHFLLLNGGEEL